MATGTAALAQKLVSKKNGGNAKKATKKAKPAAKREASSEIPWKKIADLYNGGMSQADISDKLGFTRPKTKNGKENPYPYYLMNGYLLKLSQGVEVDGKTIKIQRGSKNKARVAAREKNKDN